jgi:cobaltochelatase CobS
VTVSEFVDGILPQAISSPCMLLCDEVDFIRPDVAYVFQRALEDEGLLISEDGGRVVKPHKWSRIVATGNTQGQGDDHGIYQGARAQSMAFLDRFTAWLQCEYLPIEQEKKLIKTLVPDISQRLLNQLMKYVREHREAFTGLKISQPLSPRGVEALAKGCVFYDKRCDNALLESAKYVLLNKANTTDRAVMVGVLDRVATPKKKATSKTKNKETNKKLKEAEKEAQSLKETKEIPF